MRLVLDEPKESDLSFEVEDLTYIIDKELSEQTGEVKVDYLDNGFQQGFTIASEKPIAGGGCGSSCSC